MPIRSSLLLKQIATNIHSVINFVFKCIQLFNMYLWLHISERCLIVALILDYNHDGEVHLMLLFCLFICHNFVCWTFKLFLVQTHMEMSLNTKLTINTLQLFVTGFFCNPDLPLICDLGTNLCNCTFELLLSYDSLITGNVIWYSQSDSKYEISNQHSIVR